MTNGGAINSQLVNSGFSVTIRTTPMGDGRSFLVRVNRCIRGATFILLDFTIRACWIMFGFLPFAAVAVSAGRLAAHCACCESVRGWRAVAALQVCSHAATGPTPPR